MKYLEKLLTPSNPLLFSEQELQLYRTKSKHALGGTVVALSGFITCVTSAITGNSLLAGTGVLVAGSSAVYMSYESLQLSELQRSAEAHPQNTTLPLEELN